MAPAIVPLGGGLGFGATVSGADLRHTDPAGWAALGQALLEHSLLIVRDQHGLSPADEMGVYERLHAACGVAYSPPPPPDDPHEEEEAGSLFELYTEREEGDQELNLRGRSLPGFPAVTLLGHGPVRDHWGLPDGALIAAPLGHGCPVNWHADGEFFSRDAPPARLLQLYCIATPAQGGGLWQRTDDDAIRYAPGGTLFSSSHVALEQLSPELRARAEGLAASYTGFGKTQHGDYPVWSQHGLRPEREAEHDEARATVPLEERLVHPLVVRHPATGRELLYFQVRAATPVLSASARL